MATTPHRNYPLPDVTRTVAEEFYALQQQTLLAIDGDIHDLIEALNGLATTNHTHSIGQINGLQTALEGKMSANHTFTLASLSDVVGMAAAPDGYIPVKVGDQVVFQTAGSALGDHDQPISSITGLEDALATKLNASSRWFGTQAEYDAIAIKDPLVLYFIFAA